MKITILGCGPSGGVPSLGNDWGDCDPNEPRNRRTRVSVLVEEKDTAILIDTSPDMRQQLLACNLQKLDAVLYTHAHADHCHGIDELRALTWRAHKPIDVYGDAATMKELIDRFPFVFLGGKDKFYKAIAKPHVIEKPFHIGSFHIAPFAQDHLTVTTLGFRLNDFAYSTDVKRLDEAAFAALQGVKVWVVDCLREAEHPTHAHLALALEWIERVKPERAYLTHMNATVDYATLAAKLPEGVYPAHDGLVTEC